MTLNEQDQRVINAIFGRPQSKTIPVDLTLPPDQHIPLEKTNVLINKEKDSIRLCEAGDIENALALLQEIIKEEPEYASVYNNRAQMTRLMPGFDFSKVENDLSKAISLAKPKKENASVSKMQANVLRNACLQLGLLYNEKSQQGDQSAQESWDLQLKASELLALAGLYGESIATSLAAHVNPYAKLCGNMMEMAFANNL